MNEASSNIVRLFAVVYGRVQGVGFRDFVWRHAGLLGLFGYVRNGDDGRTVEVVAEGGKEQVERLLEYLRQGPPSSVVERVEVRWGNATGGYAHFNIDY